MQKVKGLAKLWHCQAGDPALSGSKTHPLSSTQVSTQSCRRPKHSANARLSPPPPPDLCHGLSNLRSDASAGAEDQMMGFRTKCQVPWAYPMAQHVEKEPACWPGDVTGHNRGQLA